MIKNYKIHLYIGIWGVPNGARIPDTIKIKKLKIRLMSQDIKVEDNKNKIKHEVFARLWSKYTLF